MPSWVRIALRCGEEDARIRVWFWEDRRDWEARGDL
jgi:hypothetical protein